MPTQCGKCSQSKLTCEFFDKTYSSRCEHAPSWCLACVGKHFLASHNCPLCQAPVDESTRARVQRALDHKYSSQGLEPKSADLTELRVDPTDATAQGDIEVVLVNGEKLPFRITGALLVLELMKEIEAKSGLRVARQRLLFRGTPVLATRSNRSMRLCDYRIEDGCQVRLVYVLEVYATARSLQHVVLSLEWCYPDHGPDYLDGSCLLFAGTQYVEHIDFNHIMPQQSCSGDFDLSVNPTQMTAVMHSGDRPTQSGCAHVIHIFPNQLSPNIDRLFFTLSAWNAPTIAAFKRPFINIYDGTCERQTPVCDSYEISRAGTHQAVIMACLYRVPGGWRMLTPEKFSAGNAKDYGPLIRSARELVSDEEIWVH